MELKQLRYFRAIALEGSFSSAARRIGIAQPSLSQHVRHLEDELGVELMTRSPRGIVLTEAGHLLMERTDALLKMVEAAAEEVRASGTDPVGEVSFGLPSSVSMVLSVPLAETVRHVLPHVRLRAVEAMSGFIRHWLENGELSLGILYDVEGLRGLEVRPLLSEGPCFVCAPDTYPFSAEARTAGVRLADIAALDLILPSRSHGLRTLIDKASGEADVTLTVAVEMDALTQIKTLVARGSGYTILAPAAVQDAVARGELETVRIVDPVIRRSVYLVWNSALRKSRAIREVERLTLEIVDDLVTRNLWPGDLHDDLAARPGILPKTRS